MRSCAVDLALRDREQSFGLGKVVAVRADPSRDPGAHHDRQPRSYLVGDLDASFRLGKRLIPLSHLAVQVRQSRLVERQVPHRPEVLAKS